MSQKSIPLSWVNEKINILKESLPVEIQKNPFYPDAYFYAQYHQDHLKGLHYMATMLFDFLKISPNGCVIDFYDEKDFRSGSGDTAGFYTKFKDANDEEKELIFINSKHKDNPLAVGAILAHEMMHLYLFRLNLKLEDTGENELLTDLATINTGLSILIVNGMSYSSFWWLSVILIFFGIRYWHSEQLSFGYFKPKEYGKHAVSYFTERNISIRDVVGYINPTSRRFVSYVPFLISKQPTAFIKALEKEHIKTVLAQWFAIGVFITVLLVYGQPSDSIEISQSQDKQNLGFQIESCKTSLSLLSNKIKNDTAEFENITKRMDEYQRNEEVDNYNSLVNPHNSLLEKIEDEAYDYENNLDDCNAKINKYNKL